jgi:hypothetical protein
LRLVRPSIVAVLLTAFLAATPVVSAAPTRPPKSAPVGSDISWPQCNGSYPSTPSFGIVGVNKGIVFSANPCLSSEIAWAGGTAAQLYANTGNPGPTLSAHWPDGQIFPAACNLSRTPLVSDRDTVDCAYDYGYNAAADSYFDAVLAYGQLGLVSATPASSLWWFDVETSNSWRSDVSMNVAVLQGAVAYLSSAVGAPSNIGFYSTQYQWDQITGGSLAFAAYKSWVAGAPNARGATANCLGPGFTGGGVALSQYTFAGFDADLPCG